MDPAYPTSWQRFFAPVGRDGKNLYHLGSGPLLRLVPADQPGIQTMVWQVTSLDQSKVAASSADLSVLSTEGRLTLLLPHTPGLTIQLIE